MDNQKIIIALLCVIVVILIIGVLMFSPFMAKENTNLAIKDAKLNVGDSFSVKLTDSNGNPISNRTVNMKLTDKKGNIINEDLTTNSKGNAKLKIKEKGKYSAECTFDGDDKYKSSSTADNLTVKKPTTKVLSEEKAQRVTHSSKYASDGSIYPEYGPEVDSHGITRDEAISRNMHYIEMNIDGETVGGYVTYDPNAGCYHT